MAATETLGQFDSARQYAASLAPAKSDTEIRNSCQNPPLAARKAADRRNCYEVTGRESSNNTKWLLVIDANNC